ncbi:hypothetical protein [Litorisediminicola beolgyonensis]|uniref:O-Antigen ligase n=1 Tax=Litorisediminicola beolgyonensis TaxID=1173614 RepID=A0ABW3ZIX4_9RHOB
MPNAIAFLMLALWPVVTVVLFRRLSVQHAFLAAMLGGYLLLPEPPAAFDLPLFPPLTKHVIPSLSCIGAMMALGQLQTLIPRSTAARVLLAIYAVTPVFTVITNTEPVFWGRIGLPGLGLKDAIALPLQHLMHILPFLLAAQVLHTSKDLRDTFIALVIAGLAYSVLMLIEVRLSPQLNMWVYGYYQHSFAQTIRFGGFRPMVFLYHGLWVAFFCFAALIAAVGLWKHDREGDRRKWFLAAAYLAVVLVLAKSLGALLFAMVVVPAVVLLGARQQMLLALVIASVSVAYPALKSIDLIPERVIVERVAQIDEDRSRSISFRFANENVLRDRAMEKPLFGWGSWGRNQILDPRSGESVTISDGEWVIVLGTFGFLGFVAQFGLLLLPLITLWWQFRTRDPGAVSPLSATMALFLAVNMFDLLPNATLTVVTWIVAGMLLSYCDRVRSKAPLSTATDPLTWKPVI